MSKEKDVLNKDFLAKKIEKEFELKGKVSKDIVDAIFDTISKAMEEKREVKIFNFGKFYVKHRSERNGYSPAEKKHIVIPESYVPSFEAYPKFKDKFK